MSMLVTCYLVLWLAALLGAIGAVVPGVSTMAIVIAILGLAFTVLHLSEQLRSVR